MALPDSNGYISPATADAYFATSFGNTAWNSLSAADKQIAITEASRVLDGLQWWGEKCSDTQQWAWPRKVDAAGQCGAAVCTTLPQQVEEATALLALTMNQNPGLMVPALGGTTVETKPTGAVKRQKLGDLEQEFFAASSTTKWGSGAAVPAVLQHHSWLGDLLACWIVPPAQTGQARVLTRGAGTCGSGSGCRRLDGLPFPMPYPFGLSDSSRMLPTPSGMWGDWIDRI